MAFLTHDTITVERFKKVERYSADPWMLTDRSPSKDNSVGGYVRLCDYLELLASYEDLINEREVQKNYSRSSSSIFD